MNMHTDATKQDGDLDPDLREGVWTTCNNCGRDFRLLYDGYNLPGPLTLQVSSCLSGGVYSIDVRCPYCGHKEEIY